MKFSRGEIEAFAVCLASARSEVGLPRRAVVAEVDGISEVQQLYNYEKARRAPDRIEVVLGLEDALGLERGVLCRHLGFAPLVDVPPIPSVDRAVVEDSRLSTEAKSQLLSAHRRVAE